MKTGRFVITAFGLGTLRPAPGTWGSLPPVALVLGLHALGRMAWVNAALAITGLAFSVACVAYGRRAERFYRKKDPSQVVADEVAGQSVALLFLPWRVPGTDGALMHNLVLAAVAFLSFRVLDILKPPPANQLQNLPGGWGILIDDLVAGAYALIVTQLVALNLLVRVFPQGPIVP